MKIVYIDCSAGLSGSALLGAMVELGAKPDLVVEKIKSIIEIPFQLTFNKSNISGCTVTAADLKIQAGQKAVPVSDIVNSLTAKFHPGNTGERLSLLFDRFLRAYTNVSGLAVTEVIMPEAAILRMFIIAAGFFSALEQLEIERVISSYLPVNPCSGAGQSSPLLLELAKGAAIKQRCGQGAHITPLGLALLNCRVDNYGPLPEIRLNETGYGFSTDAQSKDVLVRILYGTVRNNETSSDQSELITIVETAIDDMNPEFFPFLTDRLLTGGAVDAFLIPIYMKKGRPAHKLTVLCEQSRLEDVLLIIFKETTTLGVRIRNEKRRIIPRYSFEVNTPYGGVSVKAGYLTVDGPPVNVAPEFEDCKKLALQLGVPVKEVYAAAQRAAHEYLNKNAKKL